MYIRSVCVQCSQWANGRTHGHFEYNSKTIQTMLDDVLYNKYVKYKLAAMHTIVFSQSIVFH